MLKEIFKYRDLLFMLTFRDIRIRYKQAVMGFLWAIFMPVVAITAGLFIKKAIAVLSGRTIELTEVVSMSVKILPWTFFTNSLTFAVPSLVSNAQLVTKIYFPKAVLPLAAILACFFDYTIATAVLGILLVAFKVKITVHILWLPLFMITLFLISAGLSFFLAAANLFYRDIKYVVSIILQFGVFFSPVFYNAKDMSNWTFWILLSPLGSTLESINDAVVLHQVPHLGWALYALVSSAAVFYFGLRFFKGKESVFAENI